MSANDIPIRSGHIAAPTTLGVPDPLHLHFHDSPARPIAESVCRLFHIAPRDMLSSRRPEWIAWPRQIAMALAYANTEMSATEVAYYFGRLDHGTVLYACRKVEDRMKVDRRVREQVEKLTREIQSA